MALNNFRIPIFLCSLLLLPILLLGMLSLLPAPWLGSLSSQIVSRLSTRPVTVATAKLHLLTRSPTLTLTDVTVENAIPDAAKSTVHLSQATVRTNPASLFSSDHWLQQTRISAMTVDVLINSEPEPAQNPDANQPAPTSDNWIQRMATLPGIVVEQLDLNYHDTRTNLRLILQSSASAEQVIDGNSLAISARGTMNGLPLTLEANSLIASSDRIDSFTIDARSTLDQSSIALDGTISDTSEVDLNLDLRIPSLTALAPLTKTQLPLLPPIELRGSLQRDDDFWVLRRFDSTIGDSDFEGDLRLTLSTPIPTVYANIISQVFDLDDLAGLLGSRPDPSENPLATQTQPVPDSRLLPERVIPLSDFLRYIVGAIDFTANKVLSPTLPVDSIQMRAEIGETVAKVEPFVWRVADGVIEGALTAELPDDTLEVTIDVGVKHLYLNDFMRKLGRPEQGYGQIGGQVKLWMQGNSVAELLSSADGGMFFIMTEGRVSALLTEIAGLDLAESLALLTTTPSETTEIRCAYADLHARSGVLSAETLVMDTRDTVFLVEGAVDFNDESINLLAEPHPKDFSLLAAQTSWKLEGTLDSPGIGSGDRLTQRAAAAAVLAGLAAPVAALLPLLSPGDGQNSPYCDGLATSLQQSSGEQ